MTPKRAQFVCDQDLSCAGFTYKGAKGHGQNFEVKFFHYIPKTGMQAAIEGPDWTWTSYRVSRPYVLLPAKVEDEDRKSFQKEDELKEIQKALLNKQLWPDISLKAVIFNPIKGLIKKVTSAEKLFNLKDFYQPSSSKSSWLLAVNLDTEHSLFNVSVCSKSDKKYMDVYRPASGCSELSQVQLQSPALFDMQGCHRCPANANNGEAALNEDTFDLIANVSSWSLPSSGKSVKRSSVTRDALFKAHLRASIHDRSALGIKQTIATTESLAPLGHEEDLATKLGLRRSSQLFLDFWPKGNAASSFLRNPPGTSTTFFYMEGKTPMDWILVPTNARSELQTLTSCLWDVSSDLTIHGRAVQKGRLHPGEMIYVPQGWSYLVQIEDNGGVVTIAEARLTPNGLEEAAASFGEQEIHVLKKALEDPFWHLWRRFTEILHQRKRSKK